MSAVNPPSRLSRDSLAIALLMAASGALAAAPAAAQPASILKDIATTGVNMGGIDPTELIEFDGALYFFADDGIDGRELWRSDGTEVGTWRVRDICSGQCGSSFATELVVFQGELYFEADDGVHGRELWRSDGTEAGTELAVDVVPGEESSGPWWLTPFGDKLVFVAKSADGWEPWVTDGTPGGTVELADVNPGAGDSWPSSLTVWKGAVWFAAYDPAHGYELWTSDGTPGGTHLFEDIQPGPSGSVDFDQSPLTHFYTPTPVGDVLVFSADDGVHGDELWATDGTVAGTTLLADLEPGSQGSYPRDFTSFGGALFFEAEPSATGRELFRTDGTSAGTGLFEDLVPGTNGSFPYGLTAAGDHLFFSATDGSDGQELWVSDGTPGGTIQVEDIDPGSEGALAWTLSFSIHAFGDRLLFDADDGTHGLEPWVSDGKPGGTHMLGDVNPGSGSAFQVLHTYFLPGTLGNDALFFAFDPVHGWELRRSAGAASGATLVRDIHRQASSIAQDFDFLYTEMKDVAGTLFFVAKDPDHGLEPWATNGTEATTRRVRDLTPGPDSGAPRWLSRLGSLLIFDGRADGNDERLWTSDGTEANTTAITGASPEPEGGGYITPFEGQVYFYGHEAGVGYHLWRSDGTGAGTHPFPEGSPIQNVWDLAIGGGHLFIATYDQLWVTGGDAASTEKLADVTARDLAAAGPLLFFSGDDGASGPELWVSDGTPAGTRRVLELQAGAAGGVVPAWDLSSRLPLPNDTGIVGVASPPSAFFVGDDGVHGRELWWSDGTAANTRMLGDLRAGPLGSDPRYLTVVRGVAYFEADDGVHGAELWRSDGTEAGTYLLADLEPGPASSIPDSLTNVYGTLFFSAWRSTDGRELWRSDGTEAGTVLVQDINPGPDSSSPAYFTTSGGRLYFIANDGTRGFEPWSMQAIPPRLLATKVVSGDLRAGGHATYLITLSNPGDFDLVDEPGDELVDPLPDGLTALSATADGGAVTVDPDGRTVRWNGGVQAGGTVAITIETAIALDAEGKLLVNQAQIAYDADGSGDNETHAVSDDPAGDGGADPTQFVAGRPFVATIPALGPGGLALLALLLAAGGLALSRPR